VGGAEVIANFISPFISASVSSWGDQKFLWTFLTVEAGHPEPSQEVNHTNRFPSAVGAFVREVPFAGTGSSYFFQLTWQKRFIHLLR
jgi:hypothetical protein